MTDKQIIIDGVDVNALYSDQIACMNRYEVAHLFIKTVEQLEAKEQECEELKKLCNGLDNTIDNYTNLIELKNQQLDQLKTENEKLKKLLKVRIEDLCDSCGASSMMPMPCKVYEKTLTDIKQIMKKHCKKCKKHKFYHFQLCCTCKYTDILQKISEVEDEEV